MNLEGRIVLVHGKKLENDGTLGRVFVERLDKSVEVLRDNRCDFILVSGGQTRKEFSSEAETGAEYLRDNYLVEVVEERQSLTTIQNIENSIRVVGKNFERAYAISGGNTLKRIDFIYQNLFPEIYSKMVFVPSGEDSGLFKPLKEFLHLTYNRFDLHEEASLVKYLRKTFRNGH